ncbi:MAG: hypothetical protein RIA69_04170 [Cyclobacteriaceae bacterium]
MHSKYTPILNPFTQILKFLMLALFWGLIIYGTIRLFNDKIDELKIIAPAIFLILFLGYIGFIIVYSLWTDIKFVTFKGDSITIVYLLQLKVIKLSCNAVRGYSTCEFLNGWKTKSLILYTRDNKVIEFVGNNYLDNNRLIRFITGKFQKIGDETLAPKFWFGRTYKFLK